MSDAEQPEEAEKTIYERDKTAKEPQPSSKITKAPVKPKPKIKKAFVDKKFGDGYISLSIVYVVFCFSNFAAPGVVSVVGHKTTMFFAAATYLLTFFRICRRRRLLSTPLRRSTASALLFSGRRRQREKFSKLS